MKKIKIIKEGSGKSWFNSHINEIFDVESEDDWSVRITYNNEKAAIGKKCIEYIFDDELDKK